MRNDGNWDCIGGRLYMAYGERWKWSNSRFRIVYFLLALPLLISLISLSHHPPLPMFFGTVHRKLTASQFSAQICEIFFRAKNLWCRALNWTLSTCQRSFLTRTEIRQLAKVFTSGQSALLVTSKWANFDGSLTRFQRLSILYFAYWISHCASVFAHLELAIPQILMEG